MGSGSWGTALAVLLARNGVEVCLWGRDEQDLQSIDSDRENRRYLPGIALPMAITASKSLPAGSDFYIVAVPSAALRAVTEFIPDGSNVVIAAKGLEPGTAMRMSEVVLHMRPDSRVSVLSGPNLAVEIARGIPTATVVASTDAALADWVRERFMSRAFRVYTSTDVVGVELGGALKNVLALGAGMSDGLGFGDNTKAALLARGLREMSELGSKLGADPITFMGLSGVGDLIATAVSKLSRNYRVGSLLGSGVELDFALSKIGQVAEGVPTSEAAITLADRCNVDVPLIRAIYRVVKGECKPLEAVTELMDRSPRTEN
jgi:glycerol-3-phosphate dehydrogenase (NAD(P)+)